MGFSRARPGPNDDLVLDDLDVSTLDVAGSGVRAFNSANQALAADTNTIVALDSTQFDDRGWLDAANNRIVPDISGRYLVRATARPINYSTAGATGFRLIVDIGGADVVIRNETRDAFQLVPASSVVNITAGTAVSAEARISGKGCDLQAGDTYTTLVVQKVA